MSPESKMLGFNMAAVAVVAAIVILGLTGWQIYNANAQKNAGVQSNPHLNDSDKTEDKPAEYLRIREFGVKIELDDKSKGTSYAVGGQDDEAVFIINPTMKTIDSNNQYCAAGANPGIVGLLDRSKDPDHWGRPIDVDNINSFKIGDYYYMFRGPQAECSQDENIGKQRSSHMQDFIVVLRTIQIDR